MDWIELLTPIAATLISIFCGWAVVVFRQWAAAQDEKIQHEIGNANYELAESVARNIVQGIEQAYKAVPGEQKKAVAKEAIASFLYRANIEIDPDHIESLIESVVLGLNGGGNDVNR